MDIVGLLYETVGHPERWTRTLERIAAYRPGTAACYCVLKDESGVVFKTIAGDATRNRHAPFKTTLQLARERSFSAVLEMAYQSLTAASEGGVFLAALRPYAETAAALHLRSICLAEGMRLHTSSMDSVTTPIVMVDGSSVLLFKNEAARLLTEEAKCGGVGEPAFASMAGLMLKKAIGRARQSEAGVSAFMLPLRAGKIAYFVLRAVMTTSGERFVIAIAVVPSQVGQRGFSDINAFYGLTPAEARLVGCLLEGDSLKGYADRYNLSRWTARAQLQSVFSKTGMHRQPELIANFFVPSLLLRNKNAES